MFCIKEAFKLIGLVLDDEKSQPPGDFSMVLGVAFNTASLQSQKLLLVEPKPTRVTNLCQIIDRVMAEDCLPPKPCSQSPWEIRLPLQHNVWQGRQMLHRGR